MTRKVFFSFHYENDVWRANVVRNSWVTKDSKEAAGFIDAAAFEEVKKGGDVAIKKWIREQLSGTSVTVVLIGSETSTREYVKYELQQSYEKGNGLLGIYIHNIKDKDGRTSTKGSNCFGEIGKNANGNSVYFSTDYPCYDWIADDGYNNLGKWIEESAKKAGR
ncbi:hypothetical protein FACS1894156_9230 [Bacteroidia bacterium]|nr:hypothetical protein FACS1894156_9230 [Bacteroidia bacterium]